jgi:hypothetical protein
MVSVSSRAGEGGVVSGRPATQRSVVRVPAAADEVDDGQALRGGRVLREQAVGLRDVAAGLVVDRVTVQQHRGHPDLEQLSA